MTKHFNLNDGGSRAVADLSATLCLYTVTMSTSLCLGPTPATYDRNFFNWGKSIFYNSGFKSYEIIRCKYDAEKSSMNGSSEGKVVRKWKLKDHFSEFCCTLKYHENGRYVSFISIRDLSKSVIITPESSYKGGWVNIAHKIAKFIHEAPGKQKAQNNSERQLGTSFKEAFNNNR
ncbi:hypothetical protein H5410_042384 [Solanum commersonii]|uniref:Uncharacterized protein n=1 Tax=Solanum commersonii TaxID=4109 RepID=A0A9J5XYD0_SOLCO|nr:hypothetical protein H5410_042384 [Solanum commersonii]